MAAYAGRRDRFRSAKNVDQASDHRYISMTEALRTPRGLACRGDGPPRWLEGKTNKPAQTARDARTARRNLINLLRRSDDVHGDLNELADRLRSCARLSPCCSGACFVCWRALRRLMVRASWHLFRERGEYSWLTCIAGGDEVPYGSLAKANAIGSTEYRLMIAAARINARVFGAVDVSANEHERVKFQPHYMPHSHVLVPRRAFLRRAKRFRQLFPNSDLVDKPVQDKAFNGRRRAIAYALKPLTRRRDTLMPSLSIDRALKRPNTRKKPLRSPQRVELALALHRAGIEARIIMHGSELRTDGDDVWMTKVNRERASELLALRRQAASSRRAQLEALGRQRDREDALADASKTNARLFDRGSEPTGRFRL